MNRFITIHFTALILFLTVGCRKEKELINVSDVIVLMNSNSPEISTAKKKLIPYLNHFGVKFETIDIASEQVPTDPGNYALVIISHPGIISGDKDLSSELEVFVNQCQSGGIGILSFDPLMPDWLLHMSDNEYEEDQDVGELIFSEEGHYITSYHQTGEKKGLFGYMSVPKLIKKEGVVLIMGNNHPLLVVSSQGTGKVVQWTSQDWMYYSILGPLGGFDDCLWKSIIWAARKPFTLQALPPVATMRVDDVVGSGRQQWGETPFYWVETVNKYGFKPWLGLFIYNLTPEGVEELKELTYKGLVTSSPHAFGRPPRPESSKEHFDAYYENQMVDNQFLPDYYYPNAIPYRSEYYDEFIFFDHNNRKPWPDDIAMENMKAVDKWYMEVGPLPVFYLIPHWGEIGSNTIDYIHDKWDIEFVSISNLDKAWGQTSLYGGGYSDKVKVEEVKWSNKEAPFKLYNEPVVGKPKEDTTSSRASYTADFIELGGKKFFTFSSVISDISGYEWGPDNHVEETAARGIETLSRGLEGKSLAVLFTHETDYIFAIKPENWDRIFNKISDGISKYDPIYLPVEEALKMVRAFHNSEIKTGKYDAATGELTIQMSGNTDVPTSVFVYTEDNERIVEKSIEIPVFDKSVVEVYHLTN
ncbi:hypothetical protein ACFLSA_06990 [Bacteroidota bacterium]